MFFLRVLANCPPSITARQCNSRSLCTLELVSLIHIYARLTLSPAPETRSKQLTVALVVGLSTAACCRLGLQVAFLEATLARTYARQLTLATDKPVIDALSIFQIVLCKMGDGEGASWCSQEEESYFHFVRRLFWQRRAKMRECIMRGCFSPGKRENAGLVNICGISRRWKWIRFLRFYWSENPLLTFFLCTF